MNITCWISLEKGSSYLSLLSMTFCHLYILLVAFDDGMYVNDEFRETRNAVVVGS